MASSLQQGITAAKAGKMQEALDFLKDAIIEEPQNADVWVWIAAIIDDLDKQEIFLKKALDIDPNNIPAQRGLSYLQKRKQDAASVRGDHLSDHTSPISPFPKADQVRQENQSVGWTRVEDADLKTLTGAPQIDLTNRKAKKERILDDLPRLTPLEISFLGVIVIVFSFIGLLVASSLFDFKLPLGFVLGNRPRLSIEPPYAGVFLYENDKFFDIERHEGLPTQDTGIPTCFDPAPVIVLWQTAADPEQMYLIYETGEYTPFKIYQGTANAKLIKPEEQLRTGLYCLQHPPESALSADPQYWCFKVAPLSTEN